MRVTLNIWSLLCPLSPFFSFLSLSHTHFFSLSLSNSPRQKVHSNFGPARRRSVKTKGHCQSCSFFFFWQGNVHTVSEKGSYQPISWWQNANPAEMRTGGSTGLSIVLIWHSFVLHVYMDICSSIPRSPLSLRVEELKCQHILTSCTSQMDGHQCADND